MSVLLKKIKKTKKYAPQIWIILSILLIITSINKFPANPYKSSCENQKNLIAKIIAAEPVNINTADENGLMKLNGVGQKKAQQIIAYRTKHGKFKAISELIRVPGVSTRLINDNKGLIVTE